MKRNIPIFEMSSSISSHMLTILPAPPQDKTGWPWTEESLPLPDTMPDGSPWPFISVVTPSYNQGQFIEETIRSVLLQGYPNLEYIIIDGGSTDGSVDIIKKYERWVAYWVSEPDRGQSHAINKGWQWATGNVLAWLNSDDMYMPNALSVVADTVNKRPDAGIWHGILSQLHGEDDLRFTGRSLNLLDLLDRGALLGIRQPAAFFNRLAVNRLGFVDESFHQFLDADIGMRISAFMPIVFIPQHLAKLRVYSETKTKRHTKIFKADEKVRLFQKFFKLADLPAIFQKKRRKALAISCTELALAYAENGEKFNSWKWFFYSILYSPFEIWLNEKYRQVVISLVARNIL